jgi:5-formyltetrahydrofolate cyclo-ligase
MIPVHSPAEGSKAALRAAALSLRDALPPMVRQAAAEAIAKRPLPVAVAPGVIVSAYSPMKTEISPIPLLHMFAEAGASLALPCIAGRGHPLIMRTWDFGAPMETGQWSIREPSADAAEVEPDIVIVPLAAFDRAGHRIGYGAGYYDMTLHKLRGLKKIVAIGIAFAAQEIARVPATERDERLDLVLTEREVINFRRA